MDIPISDAPRAEFPIIGYIKTPYPEKFGIPRQPNLVPSAHAEFELLPEFQKTGVFDGLQGASHIWLLFWFHHQAQDWSPKVRPPRLGGNDKIGIFATRSPFRPSPIGLSVVQLLEVREHRLKLSGVDLLDGTPILDIKPYVPYSDCLPAAKFELTKDANRLLPVEFTGQAQEMLSAHPLLYDLIRETLAQDPRPAYHLDQREYGTQIQSVNVRWKVVEQHVIVLSVTPTA